MNVYIYQADIYCAECGEAIKSRLLDIESDDERFVSDSDSDEFPQGPYSDGGGEADCPRHCAECGVWLENPLTTDGVDYVIEAIQEHMDSGRGDAEVLKVWADDVSSYGGLSKYQRYVLDRFRHDQAYPDGFDEFWQGYLLALAFTATRETKEQAENGNPGPLFSNPGGDISEVVDLVQFENDIDTKCGHHHWTSLHEDCVNFFETALDLLDESDYERAGGDFHFTRNGHGTGFWDGDYPKHGDKLTKLCKPFGSAELCVYVQDDGEEIWNITN